MATNHLTNDGVWGTGANWQIGGAVPDTGETCMIGPLLTADVSDAGGDADAKDLGVVHVHQSYKGSFGTTGSPIQLATALAQLYSSGPMFLEASLMAGAGDINECIVAAARPDVVVELGSKGGDLGLWDKLGVFRGDTTLKSTFKYEAGCEVRVGSVSNPAGDVNLTIAAGNGTALPVLRQEAGVSRVSSTVTLGYYSNCSCRHDTAKIVVGHIGAGGYLRYDFIAVDGDNTYFYVYDGGVLDFTKTEVFKTVDQVVVYPGGTFLYDPQTTAFSGDLIDYSAGVR